MNRRARSTLFAVVLVLLPAAVMAQSAWQPAPPPLVSAENEPWFLAGSAIQWNGDLYYPAGGPTAFNPYQMVTSGSYRGIPLYTDVTLEPGRVVFVPIAGGRLQAYVRPRIRVLTGATSDPALSFPSSTGALELTAGGFVAQAPIPPLLARPYDIAGSPMPAAPQQTVGVASVMPGRAPAGTPVSTAGGARTQRPVATSGRTIVTTTNRTASSAKPPKGVNGIWIAYAGQFWVATGKAIDKTGDLDPIGTYRGFTVYARGQDRSTIYVPSADGLVVPYAKR